MVMLGCICGLSMACGALLLSASAYFKGHAAPSATPGLSISDAIYSYDEQGFPAVDWDYWKSVNPDIIGWVTVPGTAVNMPIVQAHANESAFYLTHDIYREWNYMGCPYLDAECESLGLDSRCAMVYGHNSADGSMFADFAAYSDQEFADSHVTILLQTPVAKRILQVAAISIVKGSDANNKLQFASDEEFSAWYKDRVKSSFFQLGSIDTGCASEGGYEGAPDNAQSSSCTPNSVIAFCTCSYNFWPDDERTIVYATDSLANNTNEQRSS